MFLSETQKLPGAFPFLALVNLPSPDRAHSMCRPYPTELAATYNKYLKRKNSQHNEQPFASRHNNRRRNKDLQETAVRFIKRSSRLTCQSCSYNCAQTPRFADLEAH